MRRSAILLAWHASRALLATVASVVIGVVITMAIMHGARQQVSLRLGNVAGTVTVSVLLFVPILLVLTPLLAQVGWARWQVGAHGRASGRGDRPGGRHHRRDVLAHGHA